MSVGQMEGGVLSQILGMSFEAAESLRAPMEKQ